MRTIRIDDQVMNELEKRAVEEGLVFGSPNQVMRLVLGLDGSDGPVGDEVTKSEGTMPTSKDQSHSEPRQPRRRVTGRSLLRSHESLDQNIAAYADREGLFYEWPKRFPAVLFDQDGYVLFNSETHLSTYDSRLQLYQETEKIQAQACGGISALQGYVRCDHKHR